MSDFSPPPYALTGIETALAGDLKVYTKPKGGIQKRGSIATTTDTYQDLVTHTVTNGKKFRLAKILVSAKEDTWIRYMWNTTQISPDILVSGKLPFTDWFPYDYYDMIGDGVKQFKIQAKKDVSAGVCYGEITGEEV